MNKFRFKKRLVIGAANFTQKYGADPIKINTNEVNKILNLAEKNHIYEIDTADSYLKNSKIFKKISKKFKFSSKIMPNYKWSSLDFCQQQLDSHLKNFNINSIKTLLFHDTKILSTKYGKKIFKNLENLKKKKYFNKIGISIYDTECLNYITSNFNIDVVQCPYNILDKRILTTGWLFKLKNLGIETHIRSVFLQGLLVNKFVYKKKYFKKWHKLFFEWFNNLEKLNISPIDYCLSDSLKHNFDKIIVGINSFENLKKIINFKINKKNEMINLSINDKKLIDPREWK
jgi:aryl-alcohol dehydrogenase-like predicted oxidoreductase